jgi:hypothetical protein
LLKLAADNNVRVGNAPDIFGGPVYLKRFHEAQWSDIPLLKNYSENSRGPGVTDMAETIIEGRPHRVSGEPAFHVLEVMHGIHNCLRIGSLLQG